jgi:uncharacterized protein
MKKVYPRNVRLRNHQRPRGDLQSTPNSRRLDDFLIANANLRAAAANIAQACLTLLIWPRFVAPYRWQLTRYPLKLANLHPALEGYRILQLTDFHVGKSRQSYLLDVIDRTLRERPDLVVLTGDLIDYHPRALSLVKPLLDHLIRAAAGARDGIVAIFGNHDYREYASRHIGARSAHRAVHKRLLRIIQDSPIRLLRNESLRICPPAGSEQSRDRQGAVSGAQSSARPLPDGRGSDHGRALKLDLILVGLDEMWTGRADADAAFRDIGLEDPVICLQHNPDGIEFLKPYPWQYMLCGHSHGGQAIFPLLGPLYVPMECRGYLQGFFHFPRLPGQPAALDVVGGRTMFVSRGLGHTTPIRLQCPPEATLFTLSRLEPGGWPEQAPPRPPLIPLSNSSWIFVYARHFGRYDTLGL